MRSQLRIRGYVVGQAPNPPLIVAALAALLGLLLEDGSTAHDIARSVFYIALTIWAYEEAVNGVNGFRRALGVAVGIFVLVGLIRAIGG
jgi:hypothetical protein